MRARLHVRLCSSQAERATLVASPAAGSAFYLLDLLQEPVGRGPVSSSGNLVVHRTSRQLTRHASRTQRECNQFSVAFVKIDLQGILFRADTEFRFELGVGGNLLHLGPLGVEWSVFYL